MEYLVELPRHSGGIGFCLHFTGGFRAANTPDGAWRIEPIYARGKPCSTGPLTTPQLQVLARNAGFRPVAFHRIGWIDGVYHSTWSPVVPGRPGDAEGPSELWSRIARDAPGSDGAPAAAAARGIALGLRNMDLCVERIAAAYHEGLVTHMAEGRVAGERSAAEASDALPAHVHAFFLHLGAVLDRLGSVVAGQIGLDGGSSVGLPRLVGELHGEVLPNHPLIHLLFAEGLVAADGARHRRFALAGWAREVSALCRDLVHDNPGGAGSTEGTSWVVAKQEAAGLYRYVRPVQIAGGGQHDLFDLVHAQYERCNDLLLKAADAAAPGPGLRPPAVGAKAASGAR